jgi:hypothetical protein
MDQKPPDPLPPPADSERPVLVRAPRKWWFIPILLILIIGFLLLGAAALPFVYTLF